MRLTTPLLMYQLLSTCGTHAPPMVDADQRARPHLVQFERFERWVARAAEGRAAVPDQAALRETMFAPVRGGDGVIGAWVHLPGRPALDLALAEDSAEPSLQGALRLRAAGEEVESLWRAPARSDLWVVVQRPCALTGLVQRATQPDGECVVLAREARTALGPMRVVAAFAEAQPELSSRGPESAR